MIKTYYCAFVAIASASAVLAACGQSQVPISPPGFMPKGSVARTEHAQSSSYKVLASFDATSGTNPEGTLLAANGMLYGTTSGGSGSQATGSVFSVTTAGALKLLHRFGGTPDGAAPKAGLVNVNGRFYGTTLNGGTYEAGTVFMVTKEGKEKVLYSFGGGIDGAGPAAPLLDVSGTLYGTTYGGADDGGTVFSVTLEGQETVLHRFAGYPNDDGLWPLAPLIDVKGVFYGTTSEGGTVKYGLGGGGTVFSITPSGSEKVLYSFNPSQKKGHNGNQHGDGFDPLAPLVNVQGRLYGTTAYRANRGGGGCGTVFSVSASGDEKELHAFHQIPGGCRPTGGLLKVGDMFYGTTSLGGAYNDGTLFSMTASGKENVLHSFGYGTDGSNPNGNLIDFHGTLYGTTSSGGSQGDGTVFALTP
ncbi:MAG TPA: choice-of-anchor tandem repeat GloVer-containing protein [Candidatus Cybelea sp.]|jgi:uncharacterized repeat protein (TIGR03803 family)|nr:choice-of-anchor tandem repeat GloVer-containing protein [Candidatus Cybelea sp.]